jgi:hypothetical protein
MHIYKSADIQIVQMSKLHIESISSQYQGFAVITQIKRNLYSTTYYITF